MRHLLAVFCFLLLSAPVSAQNWRLIQHEHIPLFSNVADSSIYAAIKLDSAIALPNGDSLFYNYRVENPDCECMWLSQTSPCGFDTTLPGSFNMRDTGWLGLPIIVSGNDYRFINFLKDTLLIRTEASLGSQWEFCKAIADTFIRAEVTARYTQDIFGQQDSVMEISLTMMQGPNIINAVWLNDYKIICSKEHGLIEGFYFYYFNPRTALSLPAVPYSQKIYLSGFQSGPGLKLPVNATIYDFQIGDEFHYVGARYYPSPIPEQMGETYEYRRKRIITGKWIIGNEIVYTYRDTISDDQWGFGVNDDSLRKALDDTYLLPDRMPADSFIEYYPVRIVSYRYNNDLAWLCHESSVRRITSTNTYIDSLLRVNGCFFEQGFFRDFTEANGLGFIAGGDVHVNMHGFDGYSESMIYYKKANESCGSPISFVGIAENDFTFHTKIFPNPTNDFLHVSISERKKQERWQVDILNSQGTNIYSKGHPGRDTDFDLDVRSLAPGIYLLRIRAEDGQTAAFKFIKT